MEMETTCHTKCSDCKDTLSVYLTTLSGLRITKSNVVVETSLSSCLEPTNTYFSAFED